MYDKYSELDRLISEYEVDFNTIREDKLIMKNHPKVLVMSIASLFEKQLKITCQNFIDNPIQPLLVAYPEIVVLTHKNPNKPLTDKMFAKLEGYYDTNGSEILNAQKFYNLFGGDGFKNDVERIFNEVRLARLDQVNSVLGSLMNLLDDGVQYEYNYAKQSDLKEKLNVCSFNVAERAYLSLKLRRNRVAHDYINGLSDTFEDIENFYYDAILYIVSLKHAIEKLTIFEDT